MTSIREVFPPNKKKTSLEERGISELKTIKSVGKRFGTVTIISEISLRTEFAARKEGTSSHLSREKSVMTFR